MRSARNLLLGIALGGMAIAVPVLAQPSDYPPACDASKVTKADIDRAHTVFLSGKQFLEESNYDKAISYFKDAYSIDCSVHAMLPIIATAYERKGDKGEAVRALEEYLRRAPGAPDHDVIERRIKNLKDQLARDQPPPTAAASSAAPIASTPPAPFPVAPTPEPQATPGTATSPPNPPPSSAAEGHGIAPWIVVGIGGAAALTGVVLYIVGAGDISNAEKQCKNRQCPSTQTDAQNQGNQGRSLVNAGGGLIGGGLVVAGAGLVWHFLEKPTGAPPASGAHVSPVVGPGYGGVTLAGRF
jgi:tetratricopeptide (TPR) repeat protein